jgi:hypothetical protein
MSNEFKMWAVVEVMGHQQYAGFVTEQEVAGQGFVRVDVPGSEETGEGFSKLFGTGAIYCITPVSEEVALEVVQRMRQKPLSVWSPSFQRSLPSPTLDQDEVEF